MVGLSFFQPLFELKNIYLSITHLLVQITRVNKGTNSPRLQILFESLNLYQNLTSRATTTS